MGLFLTPIYGLSHDLTNTRPDLLYYVGQSGAIGVTLTQQVYLGPRLTG